MLVNRTDVKEFFRYCIDANLNLIEQVKEVLMNNGHIIKAPYIPIQENVSFIKIFQTDSLDMYGYCAH
ncbi:hypothetical protein AB1L05_15605 [Cytobacillus horneckiae]